MNVRDVAELVPYLRTVFTPLADVSVVLSGSMSRGDFTVTDHATVASDIDIFPIIRAATDLPRVRGELLPVLGQVAHRFSTTCTAAVTLLDAFRRARHAAYVRSMTPASVVSDHLAVRTRLVELDEAHDGRTGIPADSLPWRMQPVAYYVAKAGCQDRARNLGKAGRILTGLVDDLIAAGHVPGSFGRSAVRNPSGPEVLVPALAELAELLGVHPLPSTRRLLAATAPGPDVFRAVRRLAFLENQGTDVDTAFIVARCSSASAD